jgi:hypothetical protein
MRSSGRRCRPQCSKCRRGLHPVSVAHSAGLPTAAQTPLSSVQPTTDVTYSRCPTNDRRRVDKTRRGCTTAASAASAMSVCSTRRPRTAQQWRWRPRLQSAVSAPDDRRAAHTAPRIHRCCAPRKGPFVCPARSSRAARMLVPAARDRRPTAADATCCGVSPIQPSIGGVRTNP